MLVDYSRRPAATASADVASASGGGMRRVHSQGSGVNSLSTSTAGSPQPSYKRRSGSNFQFGVPDQKFGLDKLTEETRKIQQSQTRRRREGRRASMNFSSPDVFTSIRRRASIAHMPAVASEEVPPLKPSSSHSLQQQQGGNHQKAALQNLKQLFGSRAAPTPTPATTPVAPAEENNCFDNVMSLAGNTAGGDLVLEITNHSDCNYDDSDEDSDYDSDEDYDCEDSYMVDDSCTTYGDLDDSQHVCASSPNHTSEEDELGLGYGEAVPDCSRRSTVSATPSRRSLGYGDDNDLGYEEEGTPEQPVVPISASKESLGYNGSGGIGRASGGLGRRASMSNTLTTMNQIDEGAPADSEFDNPWARLSIQHSKFDQGTRRNSMTGLGRARLARHGGGRGSTQRRSTMQHTQGTSGMTTEQQRPSITFNIRRRSSRDTLLHNHSNRNHDQASKNKNFEWGNSSLNGSYHDLMTDARRTGMSSSSRRSNHRRMSLSGSSSQHHYSSSTRRNTDTQAAERPFMRRRSAGAGAGVGNDMMMGGATSTHSAGFGRSSRIRKLDLKDATTTPLDLMSMLALDFTKQTPKQTSLVNSQA